MGILVTIIDLSAHVLSGLILAYVVLSYVIHGTRADWVYSTIPYAIMRAGRALCEPVSRLLARGKVHTGALDLSPLLTWFIIEGAARFLINALHG